MRSTFLALAILGLSICGFSQDRPLTQAEYVRLLYALDKNFAMRGELIEALRNRGIEFVVTDGIRSLTRSKGRNDDELKRALEEAGRRRLTGVTAKPLSEKEAAAFIDEARSRTLEAVEAMPDFVVKQQIQRGLGIAGTGNFRNLDRLVVAVSYRSTGQEEYRVLSLNGVRQADPKPQSSYMETGGATSTGEFVSVLATIFKKESDTRFRYVDSDEIRSRRTLMFDFDIERDKARQQIISGSVVPDAIPSGMRGRVWIDSENFRVLRIDSEATQIPSDFPVRSARRLIDYDWATISGEKYLLPLVSDVRMTVRRGNQNYESRNVIRFRDYQKYGTEVTIVAEDDVPPDNEKP